MNSKTYVLEEQGEIHETKGARAMDSLQCWWQMMRHVLAPEPRKKLKKNSSNHEVKSRVKNTSKNHKNGKYCSSRYEMIQPKKATILMQIKSLQGVETIQISSHSLKDWGDLSFLSSLL
jgi:hypothetical protein